VSVRASRNTAAYTSVQASRGPNPRNDIQGPLCLRSSRNGILRADSLVQKTGREGRENKVGWRIPSGRRHDTSSDGCARVHSTACHVHTYARRACACAHARACARTHTPRLHTRIRRAARAKDRRHWPLGAHERCAPRSSRSMTDSKHSGRNGNVASASERCDPIVSGTASTADATATRRALRAGSRS
jgi:hypothetical protein